MHFTIYNDDVNLRLSEIVENLNRLASPTYTFSLGRAKFILPDGFLSSDTYESLNPQIGSETKNDPRAFLFTTKPYDNNYFFDAPGKEIIVSFSAWEHLTGLPANNGAVYFICALIIRYLGVGISHRAKNTGCVNDFWGDKTAVDMGMRSAFICDNCRAQLSKIWKRRTRALLDKVTKVLDDLSAASRAGIDVCSYWDAQSRGKAYDVFLCYNTQDLKAVRTINKKLRKAGVSTWLDEDQLRPGHSWVRALEQQIATMHAAVVFVGPSGTGPWQQLEVEGVLLELVKRRVLVIPVILKNCRSVPELPMFLRAFQWVDFRKPGTDAFEKLLWGITGVRPRSTTLH